MRGGSGSRARALVLPMAIISHTEYLRRPKPRRFLGAVLVIIGIGLSQWDAGDLTETTVTLGALLTIGGLACFVGRRLYPGLGLRRVGERGRRRMSTC